MVLGWEPPERIDHELPVVELVLLEIGRFGSPGTKNGFILNLIIVPRLSTGRPAADELF